MVNVVIPCTLGLMRRVKSRTIVRNFLDMNIPKGMVDVNKTGRDFIQVYNALFTYVKNHPELGVTLAREDGDIILYRGVIGTDSTLCGEGMGP
jgi:hypothetical protein